MKALIIAGESVQDQEFLYPYYRLQEEGFEVDVAGPPQCKTAYGIKIPTTIAYSEIIYNTYNLLIIPGGAKFLEKLRQEGDVIKFVRKWMDTKKVIGVICHGAQILITAKVLGGRKCAGYYDIEVDIENAGATYSKEVTIDKNLISAAHYDQLGLWMKKVLEAFYLFYNIGGKDGREG